MNALTDLGVWAAALALFLLAPGLFFLAVWLVDRRVRRRSTSSRWLAFTALSLFSLAFFFTLLHVPTGWQFSSSSATVNGMSYVFGLGWLTIPVVAGVCLLVGLCGTAISFFLGHRPAATREA